MGGCLGGILKLAILTIPLWVAIDEASKPSPRPSVLWGSIGILAVLCILFVSSRRPTRCTLCGNILRRNAYRWTIDHKKHWLCPHCNTRKEREQSRRASGK